MTSNAIYKSLAAIGLLAATPILTAASPKTGEVVIDVSNLRSAKGVVLACMTTNPKIFPKCRKDPKSYTAKVAAGSAGKLTFKGVKPGRYAIALLHDENSNGKADRALSMIPKEGFGFSRDAKVRMGPPSFKSAAFDFSGAGTTLTIKMRYML